MAFAILGCKNLFVRRSVQPECVLLAYGGEVCVYVQAARLKTHTDLAYKVFLTPRHHYEGIRT